MMRAMVLLLIVGVVVTAPADHKMDKIPGYPSDYNTSIYTGYLDLKSADRGMHYLFVQSINGPNNKDPVTLWLNGGPGCSSMLGFIQQIGPYYLEDGVNYKEGDSLTKNNHSWHRVSNLLFLESPAGVGFSYNTDKSFELNDATTANDNLNAVLDFFVKYPEFRKNKFWIAGQSYAGKYIPSLARRLDEYNQFYAEADKKVDLRGILVGNGIMGYERIEHNRVQYLMGHSFINPDVKEYRDSCIYDPQSAGCGFFAMSVAQDIDELNPYNVYGYCYYNDSFGQTKQKKVLSQESILLGIQNRMSNSTHKQTSYNAAPCAYFDGMLDYFNLHEKEYKAKFDGQHWNGPCADNLTYHPDPAGSIHDYRYLLGELMDKHYTIHLYNGNWDVVVPIQDTIANIKDLNLVQSYIYTPWFTQDQHSGFTQLYSGITLTIVKGASHTVPQTKRPQAFNIFNMTLAGHADKMGQNQKQ